LGVLDEEIISKKTGLSLEEINIWMKVIEMTLAK
jgi:hypothetical protein